MFPKVNVSKFISLAISTLPRPIFAFLATFIAAILRIIDKRARIYVVLSGKHIYFIVMFGKVFVVPGPQEVMQFIMPRPFERWLTLNDNDIVIEGGSALGEDSVRIAEIVKRGIIVAVEPNPFDLVFLRYNTRYYSNVVVVDSALWNEETVLKFNVSGPLSSAVGAFSESRSGITINVSAVTVDDVVDTLRIGHVDVIKLNIKGARLRRFGVRRER